MPRAAARRYVAAWKFSKSSASARAFSDSAGFCPYHAASSSPIRARSRRSRTTTVHSYVSRTRRSASVRIGHRLSPEGPAAVRSCRALWSRAIFDHPDTLDSFQYMSRLYTNRKAVVLFDRGTSLTIAKGTSIPLYKHKTYASVRRALHIRLI